jgi:hypothetical protein
MKYRIDVNDNGEYCVRYRPRWWPFWLTVSERYWDGSWMGYVVFKTCDAARDYIAQEHRADEIRYRAGQWRVSTCEPPRRTE